MCAAKTVDETLILSGQGGKSKGAEPKLPTHKKYSLVFLEGKNAGQDYTIEKWTIIIGRDASVSDLVLDDPGASRSHACLEFEGEGFVIEDLESTNGISVNNKPATRAHLKHGDRISIGKTVLQFLEESSANGPRVYEIDDDN